MQKHGKNQRPEVSVHTSSVEIKDDKFFSMQRAKAHTTVKVKSGLKPRVGLIHQAGSNILEQRGVDDTAAAKKSVKRTLDEIEDNFKMFKYLPNQKLHPFDLTAEELAEIKTCFPEFHPKNLAQKKQTQVKGLEITDLREILQRKIQIKPEVMNLIIAKLDHRSETRISWTEFLTFLQSEGLRREVVNDAQLYGFGVKRLVEKARIKLDISNEQKSNEKAVEYFVDHLLNIKVDNMNLVLAVFENNKARLYDARDFKVVQEIKFPFELLNKHQKSHQARAPSAHTKNETRSNTASRQMSTLRDNVVNDYLTETHMLESIAENPQRREKSSNGFSTQQPRPKSQFANSKSSVQLKKQNQLTRGQLLNKKLAQLPEIKDKPKLERKDSGEKSFVKYEGDPRIIAWKKTPYVRSVTVLEDKQNKSLYDHVLGIADIGQSQQQESILKAVNKMKEVADDYVGQVKVKDFFPNFKQQKAQQEELFKKKIDELNRSISETDKAGEKQFKKLLREEKTNGLSETEALQAVIKKLGSESAYAQQLIQQHKDQSIEKRRLYSERCAIKLENLKKAFNTQQDRLADLKETNMYGFQMASAEQLMTGDSRKELSQSQEATQNPNQEVSTQMISKYIEKLKARGELAPNQDAKKQTAQQKLEQNKKLVVKNTKAVNVTACGFNDQVGLLALALIDKEVKIYKIKQTGSKISLEEYFSFYVSFHSGGAVSCLQIERYITNGRPIICMGSQLGDIAIYYLDSEKRIKEGRGPMLLKQFNFNDRGARFDLDDINKDSDDEEEQKPVRISFRTAERQHLIYDSVETKQNDYGMPDTNELITDEYWDTVLMNTRPKKEGPDGIKIWNLVYHRLKDADSASSLVKELTDLKITDTSRINHLIDVWITCLRISGNILEDAANTFRLEYAKIINPDQKYVRALKNANILKNISQKQQQNSQRKGSQRRKMSSVSQFGLRSGGTQSEQQSVSGVVTNAEQENMNKSVLGTRSTMLATKRVIQAITVVKYIKDIGLVASTFNGQVKIFDSFNFYQIWKNTNKNRTPTQHTTITSFDVSPQLGLMATVGVEGRLMLIDPYAFGIINATDAHPNTEILQVFIYTSQQQIITVACDRSIFVWDAFRLEKIQSIKDLGVTFATKFSCVSFDEASGSLCAGCQQVNFWKAQVDPKIEIQALQVQTLSKTVMQERNMFELDKLSGKKDSVMVTTADSRTGKVLVSNQSQLVSILINCLDKQNLIITIDSENLLRGWSLIDCSTSFSYKIPLSNRVTAAALDEECKNIAVGSCTGEVKVLNFASGGVLYNLPHSDQEITCLKFLSGVGEFWLIGGCWGGKVIFWTEPNEDNNFQISAKCRIGHRGDILVVECANNFIVTGGMDGLLSVWNQFSGVLKFAVTLPDPIDEQNQSQLFSSAQNQIRKKITDILFHPYWSNVVCILQESGNVHLVDISNGNIIAEFVAYMKLNSCWAVCPSQQKVFVIGDMGRASLFDIRMRSENRIADAFQQLIYKKTKRAPVYTDGRIKDHRWVILKPWFRAHQISKMDSCYVQSTCYSETGELFVSATSNGIVKLWSCGNNLPPLTLLGTLNAKDWDAQTILNYVSNPSGNQEQIEPEQKEVSADPKAK